MPRPIVASIHQSALRNNLAVVRQLARQAKVWAVVKANAYGHGIANVFEALSEADGFALLDLAEAVQLRELGWRKPILLLEGFFEDEDIELVVQHGLTTAVHGEEQLRMLELAARAGRLGDRPALDVYLKLNNGMNRLGFKPQAYRAAWERLRAIKAIRSVTHMSHFSDADTSKGIQGQMDLMAQTASGLAGDTSMANSSTLLLHDHCRAEWVRAGMLLYGAAPSGQPSMIRHTGLIPAMTLSSRILAVQHLLPGDIVGYGSRYVARQRQRIGIVACAYADGYPRVASLDQERFAPVMVGDVLSRTVGPVSMDLLAVDLSHCPAASVGSTVELWGQHIAIDDVAAAGGTIGYEMMCALAPRVPTRRIP